MKKACVFILVSVCVFFSVSVSAYADMGPKPSVTVYVNGVEDGREYYVALIEQENTGNNDMNIEVRDDVLKKIYEFFQTDEYYVANRRVNIIYSKMKGRDSADWSHPPSQEFKILLYFPDNESFLISEVLDIYAFDSYFTVKVNGDSLTVAKNGGVKGVIAEVGGLLIRIALTVLIEIWVAFWFDYRGKRELKLILITNIITQVLLNVLIAVGDHILGMFGAIFAYIAGEIVVFIAEAIVYYENLPRVREPKTKNGIAVGYAFIANSLSFFGGGVLMYVTDLLFRLIAKW